MSMHKITNEQMSAFIAWRQSEALPIGSDAVVDPKDAWTCCEAVKIPEIASMIYTMAANFEWSLFSVWINGFHEGRVYEYRYNQQMDLERQAKL